MFFVFYFLFVHFCVCVGLKVLYSRIAVALWRSSQGIERHIAMHSTSTCASENHGNHGNHQAANSGVGSNRATVKYEKRPVGATESQVFICCIFLLHSELHLWRFNLCFFFLNSRSLIVLFFRRTIKKNIWVQISCALSLSGWYNTLAQVMCLIFSAIFLQTMSLKTSISSLYFCDETIQLSCLGQRLIVLA